MKKVKYTSHRKRFFLVFLIVFSLAVVAISTFVYNQSSIILFDTVPQGDGKIAYIKESQLYLRDYSQQRSYRLGNVGTHKGEIIWSPLGKYLYIHTSPTYTIWDVENKHKISTKDCLIQDVDEIKWVGGTDTLISRTNNTFSTCFNPEWKTHATSSLSNNEKILDWIPLPSGHIILATYSPQTGSKILKISMIDGSQTELLTTQKEIQTYDGKSLWFAEDRNVVFFTPQKASRILLNASYELEYVSDISLSGNITPIGWWFDICVGGNTFIPSKSFLVWKEDNKGASPFRLTFSTPSTYESSSGEYAIQQGETYWELAQRIYGDGNRWKELYEHNTQTNPKQIQKDTRISILPQEIKQYSYDDLLPREGKLPHTFILREKDTIVGVFKNGKQLSSTSVIHGKLISEYKTQDVSYSPKTTLEDTRQYAAVQKDNNVLIFNGMELVETIQNAQSVAWDMSSGYCWNHKSGDVFPSATQEKQTTCSEYWELKQYEIMFENVCKNNWKEEVVHGTTKLINTKTGMIVVVSRGTGEIKNTAEINTRERDGSQYTRKKVGDTLHYEYALQWLNDEKFGIQFSCSNASESQCDELITNFMFE